MRKVKLQMQMSVNGFVAGPNGELDWMTWNWGDDIGAYVNGLTEPVDCILMGRVLAEGFIPHWTNHVANPETADDFGRKMVDTPKVVFSKTLKTVEWNHTRLAQQNIVAEVNELKQQPGGDIILYGGADFVSSMIENDLIDEYHLFVNPTAIGDGMTVFRGKTNLKLMKAQAFDCGIVVLHYEPSR